MNTHDLYAAFFSPTETSKKNAVAIAETFSDDVVEIDLTIGTKEPVKTDFDETDIVVFGAPVYGGRLFTGAVKRFSKLKGNNTPCIITVTYGNRDYDDALLELQDLAAANGFLPFAAAAVIGQHTFGEIQVGRPNSADLSEHREFALKAKDKLMQGDMALIPVPGNRPFKDGGNGASFRPNTTGQCTSCGLCAKSCPEQAIDYQDFSKIDDTKCIACFRCIKVCPENAKMMDDEGYIEFAAKFSKDLAARRENEYFV